MKKFFTLLLVAAATVGTMSATFVSAGTGRAYTFAQLAAIDTSGVTATDSGYVVTADFTIAAGDTLRLMNNDKVLLGDKVMVSVNGYADFAVPDTAVITRATATAAPKGFKVYDTNSGMTMKNVTMEYAGINFGSTNGHLAIDHCTFTLYNGKINSGSVVNYSNSCDGNTVTGSYFVDNTVSALGNGANTPVGLVVDNCVFLRNTTSKRNRPQINMTCGGPYDITITRNKVIGLAETTLAGGIGLSNMLGLAYTGKVTVKYNDIEDNRYGVAMIGPMNLYIEDNMIKNNNYESNPNNGGSGISIYDSSNKGNVRIKGNHIENSLWGITVIGAPTVNAGKTQVAADDPDYNPGENVLVNNGNNGELYDLYNNGTGTIYAQGNTWNVATQDSVSIEKVVFHKADNNALGLVIFMPAHQPNTGVGTVTTAAQVVETRYYNLQGIYSREPLEGLNIKVTRYSDGTARSEKIVK